MKKIKIATGKVGLVFNKGVYKKVIEEGSHWIGFGDEVKEYNLRTSLATDFGIELLIEKDKKLADLIEIVIIEDHEIALRFDSGIFQYVLIPGKYVFWKRVVKREFVKIDLNKIEITENIKPKLLKHPSLLPYIRAYTIQSYEKGILFINGKYEKILEEGSYNFWSNHIPIEVLKADMRQQQMEVSGQEILTKDKATIRINFYAIYQVNDINKALRENKDYEKQLYTLFQLALREFIGTQTLDEMLNNKEAASSYVIDGLKSKIEDLGVEVKRCGIRDIILPGDVKEIMNQVLIAQKKAEANVITRREETASTRSLLNTAKLMEDNEMLFKLKEMEYVEKIAEKINSISVSGGGQIVDQLKEIFVQKK